MTFICSTLTDSVTYAFHTDSGGNIKNVTHEVTINGGHGLINNNLVTPQGVVTAVSDADLKLLQEHPVFIEHQKNGFLTVVKSDSEKEKTAAVGSMAKKDGAAQKESGDFSKDVEIKGNK